MSSVFALRLTELGVDGADKLVPLAFMIIIGTVVLQSLNVRPIAQMLGVAMPATHGVLIVGANPFSVAIAEALEKQDVQTVICDTNWESLKHARHSGLGTYYGNPSSEHEQMHLNISPFGYMLGLSSHFEYNVTQANSFRDDFGARNVFILPPNQSSTRFHKHVASAHKSGRLLFSESVSFGDLRKMINRGFVVKVTELTQEYGFDEWSETNSGALRMLTLKPNGDIVFNTKDQKLEAEEGDKIFYFAQANAE